MLPQAHLDQRYQDWLDFHFGRIDEESDPWKLDWDFHDPDRIGISLFTRMLVESGRDLSVYSDRQLAIGLEGILFMSYGLLADSLMTRAPSTAAKLDACLAFKALYADCLAIRSPPVLGHLGETRGNPLERITYMLWDASPLIYFARATSETRGAFLSVLESALYLENPACIESALHGLGHVRSAGLGAAPLNAELDAIIDRLLLTRRDLPAALREYAIRARNGAIQ